MALYDTTYRYANSNFSATMYMYYSIIFAYLYRQGLPKKSPNEFVASPVCSENEV